MSDQQLQVVACNAELYAIVDKLTKWAMSSDKTPLAFDARDLPFDLNEVCGLLNGIDEGDAWRNLASNLDRIASFWSAIQWGIGDQDAQAEKLSEAFHAAFGFTVSVGGGNESRKEAALRRLRERLKRDERSVELTRQAIAALEAHPKQEAGAQ